MKGAIASVEIFVAESEAAGLPRRRLTLTIAAPVRAGDEGDEGAWVCRVALADLHRPTEIRSADSVTALAGALDQAREWLAALRAQPVLLFRDRTGETRFDLDEG